MRAVLPLVFLIVPPLIVTGCRDAAVGGDFDCEVTHSEHMPTVAVLRWEAEVEETFRVTYGVGDELALEAPDVVGSGAEVMLRGLPPLRQAWARVNSSAGGS